MTEKIRPFPRMDIPPQQANVYSWQGTIDITGTYSTSVTDKSRRHAANQDCDAGVVGHNDLKGVTSHENK